MMTCGARLYAIVVLLLSVLNGASALSCYQGTQNSTAPLNGTATACPVTSYSCVKQLDTTHQMLMLGCQTTNCTDTTGNYTATGVCQNSTAAPYSTYCCCYGDGCNSAPRSDTGVLMVMVALLGISLLLFRST